MSKQNWTIAQYGDPATPGRTWHVSIKCGDRTIAQLGGRYSDDTLEQAWANARLIAASPMLLAACQRWAIIAQRDGLQELRGLAWHDGDLEALTEAIARATGEGAQPSC